MASGLPYMFDILSVRSLWLTSLVVFLVVMATSEAQRDGYRIEGRQNVCARTRRISRPEHVKQTYQRPIQIPDFSLCAMKGERPCNRTRTTYQTSHRIVLRFKVHTQMMPTCCPGWRQRSPRDKDCLEPMCSRECQNGGQCMGPEMCQCPEGFAGQHCQTDIDECAGRNDCQHKCTNLPGSYECSCSSGFQLARDGASCELCLTCTPEFESLKARVESIPGEVAFMIEEDEKKRNVQADMVAEMRRHTGTFDKLQSQYDSFLELRKKVDILPDIVFRLENLTDLHTQVAKLELLAPKVINLEERLDEGLADIKAYHAELGVEMEAMDQRWQRETLISTQSQTSVMDSMQQKLDQVEAKFDKLEQQKVNLDTRLTDALARYEEAVDSMNQTVAPSTSSTETQSGYYGASLAESGDLMPEDRLASLSQQISILEERLSECNCNQQQYGYFG